MSVIRQKDFSDEIGKKSFFGVEDIEELAKSKICVESNAEDCVHIKFTFGVSPFTQNAKNVRCKVKRGYICQRNTTRLRGKSLSRPA